MVEKIKAPECRKTNFKECSVGSIKVYKKGKRVTWIQRLKDKKINTKNGGTLTKSAQIVSKKKFTLT